MEWLALISIITGGYLLDSAIVDRAPLKFLQQVISDPTNFALQWSDSKGTGGRGIGLTFDTPAADTTDDNNDGIQLGPTGTPRVTNPDGGTAAADGIATIPPGGVNGAMPANMLAKIPWAPTQRVWVKALPSLIQMNTAYKKKFGTNLVITSAYRTLAQQKVLHLTNPSKAAAPGESNHGYGTAIDFGGGIQTKGTAQHNWMQTNASVYRWQGPLALVNTEPWHYEYSNNGTVNSTGISQAR